MIKLQEQRLYTVHNRLTTKAHPSGPVDQTTYVCQCHSVQRTVIKFSMVSHRKK